LSQLAKAMTPTLQSWIIAGATVWSMATLTATYAGFLKADTAFVASVLGGAISAAGLNIGKKEEPAPPASKKPDKGDPGTY
jgi:hypothetical protein